MTGLSAPDLIRNKRLKTEKEQGEKQEFSGSVVYNSTTPWTARRSSQSILKDINPEYSLEGLMLKLKLQYFGHLMRRADSL